MLDFKISFLGFSLVLLLTLASCFTTKTKCSDGATCPTTITSTITISPSVSAGISDGLAKNLNAPSKILDDPARPLTESELEEALQAGVEEGLARLQEESGQETLEDLDGTILEDTFKQESAKALEKYFGTRNIPPSKKLPLSWWEPQKLTTPGDFVKNEKELLANRSFKQKIHSDFHSIFQKAKEAGLKKKRFAPDLLKPGATMSH